MPRETIKKGCLFVFLTFLCALSAPLSAFAERDVLELRIPCRVGESACAVMPDGSTVPLGTVRRLPVKTNWPAYTASKWGTPGTVCASAVNAVHMLVDVEKGRGRILSVVPAMTVAPAAAAGAFFALDFPAGTGFFGGMLHGNDGVCALGNSSARHDSPCGSGFKNVGLVISCRDVASDRDGDGVLRGGLEIVIEVKCVAIHSRI